MVTTSGGESAMMVYCQPDTHIALKLAILLVVMLMCQLLPCDMFALRRHTGSVLGAYHYDNADSRKAH